MRDIKFRAWDKVNKKIVKIDSLTFWISNELGLMYVNNSSPTRYSLMQYTGLKDKNGKEIYEGDIVEVVCGCEYTSNMAVIFENGKFQPEQIYQHDFDTELDRFDRYEVIGNIYENKELLNE